MKAELLAGLAEILEVQTVDEATVLAEVGSWDSLAIVCTIALIDEKANTQVSGEALIACKTASDVLRLAEGIGHGTATSARSFLEQCVGTEKAAAAKFYLSNESGA